MKLTLRRYSPQKDDTLGVLFIDGKFACYTLEDEHREVKVLGETCIPEGKYKIGLRTEGGFDLKYKTRFPAIHKGMLQVLNVPGFEYILIHVGNTDKDTAGCILVGNSVVQNVTGKGSMGDSAGAYVRIYPQILKAIQSGEEVTLEIITVKF